MDYYEIINKMKGEEAAITKEEWAARGSSRRPTGIGRIMTRRSLKKMTIKNKLTVNAVVVLAAISIIIISALISARTVDLNVGILHPEDHPLSIEGIEPTERTSVSLRKFGESFFVHHHG